MIDMAGPWYACIPISDVGVPLAWTAGVLSADRYADPETRRAVERMGHSNTKYELRWFKMEQANE